MHCAGLPDISALVDHFEGNTVCGMVSKEVFSELEVPIRLWLPTSFRARYIGTGGRKEALFDLGIIGDGTDQLLAEAHIAVPTSAIA